MPDIVTGSHRQYSIVPNNRGMTVLPNPLHPAIVHFPVVLAFLLPIVIIGAIWAIRRGVNPRRAWSFPLAAAVALAGSAWVASETGEAQEERVERVISEKPLSVHEEMAELFLAASVGLAVVAAAGLAGGMAGRAARITAAVGSMALIVGAFRVGHSGGELVYRYGAANAYVPAAVGEASRSQAGPSEVLTPVRRSDGDGDDDGGGRP